MTALRRNRTAAILQASDPITIDCLADVGSYEWVCAAARNPHTPFRTLIRLAKKSPIEALDELTAAASRHRLLKRRRLMRAISRRRFYFGAPKS